MYRKMTNLQVYLVVFSVLHMPKITFSHGDDDTYLGHDVLDFIAHLGMVYAVAPQQIQKFPPENVAQPGDLLGGAGALLADAFKNPLIAGTIGFLSTGVSDGLVLSAFSSEMNDTFAIPRIAPATAFVMKETDTPISRRALRSSSNSNSCRATKSSKGAVLKKLAEIGSPIFGPLSAGKSKLLRRLGWECYGPRFLRAFEPLIERITCKLGLEDDRFMPTPPCNFEKCVKPPLQETEITRDMGFANPEDALPKGVAHSNAECFNEVPPVMFGLRVITTLLDEAPCEDYKYQKMCQEALLQNRMIQEDGCKTPGCAGPDDDPFMACLGCDESNYDHYGNPYLSNHIDRQTGEMFQATQQSRRVICGVNEDGGQKCRLRIDKAMQFRRVSYGRAIKFIQSEQYLGDDDVDIIRRR